MRIITWIFFESHLRNSKILRRYRYQKGTKKSAWSVSNDDVTCDASNTLAFKCRKEQGSTWKRQVEREQGIRERSTRSTRSTNDRYSHMYFANFVTIRMYTNNYVAFLTDVTSCSSGIIIFYKHRFISRNPLSNCFE